MRRSTMLTLSTAMILLLLVAFASAQMMNMMGGQSEKDVMATSGDTDSMDMMKNMSNHCQMMADNFGDLQKHFDTMMKMDNMGELKKEMRKHHEMMTSMHQQMTDNRKMCSEMMSTMGSGGMHGHMIGQESGETSKASDHDHNH